MFFFPNRSLDEANSGKLTLKMIKSSSKALFIVPDYRVADKVCEAIEESLKFATFSAKEIEHSKEPFISEKRAVAVVANRYDGIDFPDDECRLLIVQGLPRATNLQEKFIITRMGAGALLNDRIVTRIMQAFGRCTRSATDYAVIIVRDEELHNYLLMQDRRMFLHPELQAELEFGIEQSKETDILGFMENLQIFLRQDDEWREADNYIVSLREGLKKERFPGTADLKEAAIHEISFQNALWSGDYVTALEQCRKILGVLDHEDLRGYRALWNYLAGSAAWLSYDSGMIDSESTAQDYFESAKRATGAIRWLTNLSRIESKSPIKLSSDNGALILIERLEQVLENLGISHDRKFAQEEKFIIDNLDSKDSTQFELAHERLGKLLGFDAG